MNQQVRPRISQDEFEIIKDIRTRHEALASECEANGIPIQDVKHYWFKGDHFSINVANKGKGYMEVRDEVIQSMSNYAPSYKYPTRDRIIKADDYHLLVVDPADIHIGKLSSAFETGEDYNVDIAVKRVMEGVYGIIEKSSGFKKDRIMYVIGNDILHVDTPKRQTTSGTPQDTDGMWYDNFLIAKQMHIEIIEVLREIADVYVQYDPSNHDYTNGFFLADTINSWFSKDKAVVFNCSIAHRKYFRYGNNLIGTTHGDGAKEADLPMLMAHESGLDWSECKHKYFYVHHLHHKRSRDYMGVNVETLRSPSGTDSWHHRNGYAHAPKAVEGFLHHKLHGQVARFVHIF